MPFWLGKPVTDVLGRAESLRLPIVIRRIEYQRPCDKLLKRKPGSPAGEINPIMGQPPPRVERPPLSVDLYSPQQCLEPRKRRERVHFVDNAKQDIHTHVADNTIRVP